MTIRRTIELAAFAIALVVAAMAIRAWLASRDDQQSLATTLAQQKQLLDAADARERSRQSALDDTLAQIDKLKRSTHTPQQIVAALAKYLSLPQPITLQAGTTPREAAVNDANRPRSLGTSTNVTLQGTTSPAEPFPSPADHGADDPSEASASATLGASPQSHRPASPKPSQAPEQAARAPGLIPAPCAPHSANCTAEIPSADLKPLYDYVQDCRACQAQLAAAKQSASDDATKISALATQRDAAVTAAKGGSFWRRLRRNAEWFALGAAVGTAAGYRASRR